MMKSVIRRAIGMTGGVVFLASTFAGTAMAAEPSDRDKAACNILLNVTRLGHIATAEEWKKCLDNHGADLFKARYHVGPGEGDVPLPGYTGPDGWAPAGWNFGWSAMYPRHTLKIKSNGLNSEWAGQTLHSFTETNSLSRDAIENGIGKKYNKPIELWKQASDIASEGVMPFSDERIKEDFQRLLAAALSPGDLPRPGTSAGDELRKRTNELLYVEYGTMIYGLSSHTLLLPGQQPNPANKGVMPPSVSGVMTHQYADYFADDERPQNDEKLKGRFKEIYGEALAADAKKAPEYPLGGLKGEARKAALEKKALWDRQIQAASTPVPEKSKSYQDRVCENALKQASHAEPGDYGSGLDAIINCGGEAAKFFGFKDGPTLSWITDYHPGFSQSEPHVIPF
ncbi:hypothetical protein ACFY2W_34140 [Streptomyces sp. NPDC001262]|uniref:hypothetical protein n=1 Tax=Streptomyces sp. NPDC001262 TaxID=3364552 RepID=UPI0036839942